MTRWNTLGAASGFGALLSGGIGGALERGWPDAGDPLAVAAFIAEHRTAILGQSMCFLLSSALYVWFIATLCRRLESFEAGRGELSRIALGAGMVWVAISMMAQAFQVGITMSAANGVEPGLMRVMAATFAIANLPGAVMLLAIGGATFRYQAFPRWLGWISLGVGVSELGLWSSLVVSAGPLAPNGWLTYTLYPLFLVWLVPTTVILFRQGEVG